MDSLCSDVTTTYSSTTSNVIKFSDSKDCLIEDKVTIHYRTTTERNENGIIVHIPVKEEIARDTERIATYQFREITVEELKSLRKTKTPSFVYKEYERYFYCEIPYDKSFLATNELGNHMCSCQAIGCCERLSAASDKDGGCAKVRGYSIGIEKYPYIQTGYETFNTSNDVFVVLSCQNFKLCESTTQTSRDHILQLKVGLAQFVWDDIDNIGQVRKRIERNLSFCANDTL